MLENVENHLNNIRTDIEQFLAEQRATEGRMNEIVRRMHDLEPRRYFPVLRMDGPHKIR